MLANLHTPLITEKIYKPTDSTSHLFLPSLFRFFKQTNPSTFSLLFPSFQSSTTSSFPMKATIRSIVSPTLTRAIRPALTSSRSPCFGLGECHGQSVRYSHYNASPYPTFENAKQLPQITIPEIKKMYKKKEPISVSKILLKYHFDSV